MKLLFKDVTVAQIDDVFESDGTWFGTLVDSVLDSKNEVAIRAHQFIKFCVSWNESQAGENARIADEFNAFIDVVGDGLWQLDDGCKRIAIAQSPNFHSENEVSWTKAARQ
jgi:hypothetical protein